MSVIAVHILYPIFCFAMGRACWREARSVRPELRPLVPFVYRVIATLFIVGAALLVETAVEPLSMHGLWVAYTHAIAPLILLGMGLNAIREIRNGRVKAMWIGTRLVYRFSSVMFTALGVAMIVLSIWSAA